jgi:FkbM family methyltransferase
MREITWPFREKSWLLWSAGGDDCLSSDIHKLIRRRHDRKLRGATEMEQESNWLSRLFLRAPEPMRSLRKVPVLGRLFHFVSYRVLQADQKVWAQVQRGPAQGLWLELNPRTGRPYLLGEVEPVVQEVLGKRLSSGMVFYDLGANIGFFSLLAARIVGPDGHVFSFEPDPEVATRLRRNIARNNLSNVTVVEAGLWSFSGKVNFVAADSSSPDRGTGQFVGEHISNGTPTRCVSLDDFVADAPLPDAIKCDVEGAEVETLRGAEALLRASPPWILCEMHSELNDRSARDFLENCGYHVESVDGNHILALPGAMGRDANP